MQPVILDDVLRARLNGLNEPVLVNEPTGETVGCFIPQEDYLKYLYLLAQHAVSDEELESATGETGGRTLAEMRADWMKAS